MNLVKLEKETSEEIRAWEGIGDEADDLRRKYRQKQVSQCLKNSRIVSKTKVPLAEELRANYSSPGSTPSLS